MDCFHNTDVLQQSENDLFALRIKKPLFAFFSQFILVCSNWRMCQKRTWYQRILCFIVIFFFNIKHKIGTLLLLSGLFSLVTQVFSIDFTLYLWFVYLIKSSLVHITDKIYWWLTYSYLYFFKRISLGKLFVRSSGTLKIKYHLYKIQ